MLVPLMIVGVAGVVAAAQERRANVREVTLALVERLSNPGLRAEIRRSSDPGRRDLILLPRDATVETLASALASYREAAAGASPRAGGVERIGLTESELRRTPDLKLRARAVRMLAKVRAERPTQIGRLGRGRWTVVNVRLIG